MKRVRRRRWHGRCWKAFTSLTLCGILLIALSTFLFIFSVAEETNESLIILNQSTYFVTQPILINITSTNMTNYTLRVQHDGEEFLYNGELSASVSFEAPREGVYTFMLVNKETRIVLDSVTATVIDPNIIEPLPSEAISNRLITIDRSAYLQGETVRIGVNYNLADFSLRLLSPTTVYRFLGAPTAEIVFVPEEIGDYTLQFIIGSSIVEERTFSVVAESLETPLIQTPLGVQYLPYTNIEDRIQNHEGTPLAKSFTVRKDGRVIQSSITPAEEYEVEIIPEEMHVQRVRFNKLRFSERFDLGLEELDPKLNYDSEQAVYALAVDPSRLNFTNATITLVSPGTEIYKCTEYNFTAQRCEGQHVKIADVKKGSTISLVLTPEDPLFTFTDSSINCSCTETQDPKANSGTISCNTYCAVTVDAPGATALTGFVTEITYVVQLTYDDDGTALSNGDHEGDFDHDQAQGNGTEVNVGTSTATTTQSIIWTVSNLNSTGNDAFNHLDCDNWPTNCTNYDVYLDASADFQATGKSEKAPTITISLTTLNVTWNYTEAGDLTVVLNTPTNNNYTNNYTVFFNYTPSSSATNITNCTLYNNDTSWGNKSTDDTITNNTVQTFNYTFSSDGPYLWNVRCIDSSSNDEFGPVNYTINIDTVDPTVNLMLPTEGATENQSVVNFTYNVSDTSPIANCSLLIDGSIVDTETTITKDTELSFLYSLANGDYTWAVQCYDRATNPNTSETRNLTVNATPVIWSGAWYESSSTNCTGYGSCNINLEQQTDGTVNTQNITVPSGDILVNQLNATSTYMGGNGAFISSAATIDFSAYYSFISGGTGTYLTWKLYSLHTNGSEDLICQFGNDAGTGARIQAVGTETGSCSPSSDVTMASTDKLKLVMNLFNDHASQDTTLIHDWDDSRSFVNISDLQTIGTFSIDLVTPNSSITISQSETFNMTCQATCSYGYCINTNVWAQQNTSATAWINISSSGNLILGGGETNPHSLGNISGDPTSNSTNTTFVINGSQASTNNIRCFATTQFDSSTGATIQQVTVGDSEAPNVSLVNPPDETYTSNTTVILTYFVNDTSSIANCSLYINDSFNQTNQTPVTNPGNNQFSVIFPAGSEDFNWTVHCFDVGGLEGNATNTWDVHIDTVAPNITLNSPNESEAIGFSTVTFNWTAFDNRAENLSCDLYIDGSVNITGIASPPGQWVNRTVTDLSVGSHNWSITCTDNASLQNSSETRNFTVTDAPPTVTLLSPGNNTYDGDGNLTLTYNASDNNGFLNCSLYFDGIFNQSNQTPVLNNQSNNFTLTSVPEGLHNWTVNCTDTAGFTDEPTARNVTVDLTDPNVALIAPVDTELTDADVTFQFNFTDSLSPNGTCDLQYNTSASSTAVSGITAQNNSVTNEPETNLPDGIYSWNVTCLDLATHSVQSGLELFNVSESPSIALNSPAPNAYRNGASVNFTFTPGDNDGFANCTLRLLTGPNVSNTTNTSPIINGGLNWILLTGLASGSHTWSVRCVDNGTFNNVGQPAARFLFIDNADPNVTLNYPVDEQVNSSSVNFNWTADDDQDLTLSCDLYVNGLLNVSGISSSAGSPTNRTVVNFTNGNHNWSVNCSDDAGNWNMSNTTNFTVFVPPSTNLTFPGDGDWFNYTQSFTFEYVPTANGVLANCTLYIDGLENETNSSIDPDNFNYFFIDFDAGDEGNHTWNVYCIDEDNLTGGSPVNLTYYLDLTKPSINLTAPGDGDTLSHNNVTFNYTPSDNMAPNVTCNLTVDGLEEEKNVTLNVNEWHNFSQVFPDGIYTWNVTCFDLAGNFNTSVTRNFTIFAPPNVTLLDPGNGDYVNSSTVNLIYLPEDGYPIIWCNLTLDGQANNDTHAPPTTNSNNTFTVNGFSEGLHNWTVNCLDSDGNTYAPPAYNFTVDINGPNVTLLQPGNTSNLTVSQTILNFTANDTLDTNLTCNLTLDDSVINSSIPIVNGANHSELVTGLLDGLHYWNVTCVDDATNSNTSNTWNFNISVTPNVTLHAPGNDTWTNNVSVIFTFNVSDNDGFSNCTLFLNQSGSTNESSITNNAQNAITNSSMPEGIFNWTINCTDNGTYSNMYAPAERLLYVDRTGPTITLIFPDPGDTTNSSVNFNYSVTDNLAPNVTCTLYLDGSNLSTDIVLDEGWQNVTEPGISFGIHYWNVTCVDLASNSNTSETRNFTVPAPDLTITSGNITFSNSSPIEGQNITINATVFNIGNSSASNITVQFWLGDPDNGGTQINGNQTINLSSGENTTLSQNFTVQIGVNNIYVVVDPPTASNGSITETNETNNKANMTLEVGSYDVFSGDTNNVLRVADTAETPVWTWNISNATGSNVFVADTDSSLDFTSFQALGRNTSNSSQFDDFADLDSALNMTNNTDSINATWTSGGTPLLTRDYTLFSNSVQNVPIVNSTNTTAFQTGILWDTSDGGTEYNGTQDVTFLTLINESQVGQQGTYDYEIKVPAELRDLFAGSQSVTFYVELR